jgi:hypothetical protein
VVWIVLGLACGLPILGFAAIVAVSVGLGLTSYQQAGGAASSGGRQPGVLTGSIVWREISPPAAPLNNGFAMPPMYSSVMAGDFDGDGDDELLLQDYSGPPTAIELDGKALPSKLQRGSSFVICAWDCDGDGKAELIRETSSGSLEALDLQGKVVKTLPYSPVLTYFRPDQSYQLKGDADGDGKAELWLAPAGSSGQGIVALSPTGKEVVREPSLYAGTNLVIADFDGNGKSVCLHNDMVNAVEAIGPQGIRKLGHIANDLPLSGCLDVNGDSQPDVLCGEKGYIDHASGKYTAYKHKSDFAQPYSFAGTNTMLDFDGDGVAELVYAGPDTQPGGLFGIGENNMNGRLRIFQPANQQVLYDEVIAGGYSQTVLVAKAGGKQYLVMPQQSKLLIYP